MKSRSRRIFLIFIAVLTLFLGAIAVIIGIRITQDQAPEDSSANACGSFCANPGNASNPGTCPVGALAGGCSGTWQVRDSTACGSIKECYVQPLNAIAPPPTVTGCSVQFASNTGSFTISNCDSAVSFELFYKHVSAGTTDSQCIPTTANKTTISLGNGTYDPRNLGSGCGRCVQVDTISGQGYTGSGGSAQYSGDCPVVEETVSCHKCTDILTDGATCTTPETFSGTSCPAGYVSSSSSCGLTGSNGACAVQKTCYRCTTATNDGDLCEAFTVNSSTCPTGTSESSNGCANAAGGSCTNVITCYRCSDLQSDGDTCEPLVVTGTACPAGTSSTANGCAAAVGGSCSASVGCNEVCDGVTKLCTGSGHICFNGRCRLQSNTSSEQCLPASTPTPSGLPETGLFDDEKSGIILLGFLLIIAGIVEYRYQLFAGNITKALGDMVNSISFYRVKVKELPKERSQKRAEKFLRKSEKRWSKKFKERE